MIIPTIGRKVWFRPNGNPTLGLFQFSDQAMDATVVHVWSDTCVNLLVNDHDGQQRVFRSVTLRQAEDPAVADGQFYCEWMPFQNGQAKPADPVPPAPATEATPAPTEAPAPTAG